MKYETYFVYVNYNGKELSGFGQNGENPQTCAKRLIFEATGIKKDFVVAVSANERLSVEKVDPGIRNSWPSTIKTIDIFRFNG